MSPQSEIRRARPLLGTFVEIRVQGSDDEPLLAAIEAGFAAVEEVGRLMSFHDTESDVSALNNRAWKEAIQVHPWTYEVLSFAHDLGVRSQGIFNVAVAEKLVEWDFLPRPENAAPFVSDPSAEDLLFQENFVVSFRRPMLIDLGGIAKGFAVDRAIEAIKKIGVSRAVVNAGGDLRVFGPDPEPFHVRHPENPGAYFALGELCDEALATSSASLHLLQIQGRTVSPLVHGVTWEPVLAPISISVRAKSCMVADALTKVLLWSPENAEMLLASFAASAYKVEGGKVFTLGSIQ